MAGTKADAERFSREWAGKGDENQDTQRFWISLLQDVLGVDDAIQRVRFEVPVQTDASDHNGYVDVFIPSARVIVEQKSLGIDLSKPEKRQGRMVTPAQQALAYAQGMPLTQQPRYVVVCNFAELWVYDREANALCKGDPLFKLPLSELPKNLAAIQFLAGEGTAPTTLSEAVSVKAGKIMGHLHDLVAASFIDPNAPESHHALSVLMTRLMFLMFCEDAGLVEPNAFRDYIQHFQAPDLRQGLKDLFCWLDTPDAERDPYAGEWLRRLPYMNGGLFREQTEIPPLSEDFRTTLIVEGCQEFDWSGVSPTVFGSIFEGALSHDHRRANGQHFTSPENIHKVIDPLFMDELEAEFEQAKTKPVAGGARRKALEELHDRVGSIGMLDPACGSGNFLTESYLCLRKLENKILFELKGEQASMSFEETGDHDVLVSLRNFHGIELEDFACCVARTALWIAEKQADADTAKVTQRVYQELPLTDYEGVIQGNALRLDWNDVVPAGEVDYVIGNPPFIGASFCNTEQKGDVVSLFGKIKLSNSLDYVSGWYYKAAEMCAQNPSIRAALVSTNSITQGEQVAPLWITLRERFRIRIDFAWRSFVWNSEATDEAHVHCVIIGFSSGDNHSGIIYSAKNSHSCATISPYLVDAPFAAVQSRSNPICDVPKLTKGSQASDGGFLILSDDERNELVGSYPGCEGAIKPFVGAFEFLRNTNRWCLWLKDVPAERLLAWPKIMERVRAVAEFRRKSTAAPTRKMAEKPTLFFSDVQPDDPYIAVPRTSSQRRHYIPMGFMPPTVIASDSLSIVHGANLYLYGVMQSSIHNAWMRVTAGRLKSDYRYSGNVVYNNFIWPDATPEQRERIESCAQAVLDARAAHPDATLADMYNPDNDFLFPDLMAAHTRLDAAVEAAYGVDFGGDEERIVAHLFKLYAEKTGAER